MQTIVLPGIVAALLALFPSTVIAGEFDGWCFPYNECMGDAISIHRNSYEQCESRCKMENPTSVRGMDATLYDVTCSGDWGSESKRMLFVRFPKENSTEEEVLAIQKLGWTKLERCPTAETVRNSEVDELLKSWTFSENADGEAKECVLSSGVKLFDQKYGGGYIKLSYSQSTTNRVALTIFLFNITDVSSNYKRNQDLTSASIIIDGNEKFSFPMVIQTERDVHDILYGIFPAKAGFNKLASGENLRLAISGIVKFDHHLNGMQTSAKKFLDCAVDAGASIDIFGK